MNIQYNFRIGPEAVWLIVNSVLGTFLVTVMADLIGVETVADLGDINSWLVGLGFGLVRTLIGAILAVATSGGFQMPGEPGPPPAPPQR